MLLVLVYSAHTGWRFDGFVQCNWKKKDGLLKGRLETEYTPDEITHSQCQRASVLLGRGPRHRISEPMRRMSRTHI